MKTKIEAVVEHGLLKITGRFDVDAISPFYDARRKLLAECPQRKLVLDMAGVSYMDSSGLGMLLVLHEDAEKLGKTLSLIHCKPLLLNILRTAQLHRLLTIDDA